MGGCSSCSSKAGGLPTGCRNNGWCKSGGCGSILDVHDWLSNVYYIDGVVRHPLVEVKFKGTRKEYYKNSANIDLEIGDAIVVESATSGWDLGFISLTGDLVKVQMKKNKLSEDSPQIRRVVRRATENDLQRYEDAKAIEFETMMRGRAIARDLNLVMKISDVEYQGDRTKATFFYTAEGRVDFRELIKGYAREFKVKIEMRQIGLRQEAGRLGGIGSCGRELCCSTWLTDFHSVPTTAARYQNLFLNPLKLSGQCGRLKCCLNYELDTYIEALDEFPEENTVLRTEKGNARVEKMDILKKIVWFRYEDPANPKFYPLEISSVEHILMLNGQGVLPPDLDEYQADSEMEVVEMDYKDMVGEDRLDRFEHKNRRKKKGDNNRGGRQGGPNQGPGNQGQRPQGQGQRPNQPQNRGPRPEGQAAGPDGMGAGPAGPNNGTATEGQERPQRQNNNNPNRPQGGERPNRGNNPRGQNQRPQGRDGRPDNRERGPRPPAEGGPEQGPNENRPQQPNRGERPERGPSPEGRGPRPDNSGPRQEGTEPRPEGSGPRPDGRGPRPEGSGPRPDGKGPRPEGRGPRPENRGPRPDSGPRPEGQAPGGPEGGNPEGGGPDRPPRENRPNNERRNNNRNRPRGPRPEGDGPGNSGPGGDKPSPGPSGGE